MKIRTIIGLILIVALLLCSVGVIATAIDTVKGSNDDSIERGGQAENGWGQREEGDCIPNKNRGPP